MRLTWTTRKTRITDLGERTTEHLDVADRVHVADVEFAHVRDGLVVYRMVGDPTWRERYIPVSRLHEMMIDKEQPE